MIDKAEVLKEIIKERRSIFPASYIRKEISLPLIKEILESANYAPTHKLTEPWRFTVFLNEGKQRLSEELSRIYLMVTPREKFLQKKHDSISVKTGQAGCVIAIHACFHPDKLPEWEEVAALGCAVQNMSLTAAALDIGSYWSSPGTIKGLGEFLGLKDNEKCLGLLYMGYHDASPRNAVRTPIEDKVKWVLN